MISPLFTALISAHNERSERIVSSLNHAGRQVIGHLWTVVGKASWECGFGLAGYCRAKRPPGMQDSVQQAQ